MKLKGIDGGPHKRWIMWFNSMQREEPYLGLIWRLILLKGRVLRGVVTGAAWLSSARVVRCLVKSSNERNPCLQLPARNGGNSEETAPVNGEEGGDDVKSSWPLRVGLHTCYNGGDSGQLLREKMLIPKNRLSSDCTLQLECMKLESLVIVEQHATVNTFPGLVHTARHTMGVGFTLRRCANLREAAGHGRVSDWGEVVTR